MRDNMEYLVTACEMQEIDRITLNDNGETESFTDKPWEDVTDFTETESGFRNHYVTEGDPPKPVLHCTVTPTHIEWNASVTYEIREIRPDGRFIEPDSGVRTYKINYHAESDDLRECTSDPNEWTDIEYNVTANIGTDLFFVGATPSRLLMSAKSGLAITMPIPLAVSMDDPPPMAMM